MSQENWLQLAALLMCALLIMPAVLRLPWRSGKILLFAAIWLAIFVVVSFAYQLLG